MYGLLPFTHMWINELRLIVFYYYFLFLFHWRFIVIFQILVVQSLSVTYKLQETYGFGYGWMSDENSELDPSCKDKWGTELMKLFNQNHLLMCEILSTKWYKKKIK